MTTTLSPLTFRGRLPGVAADPALPPVDQPVRLDKAGFVGFAAQGPLDLAVPVEDPTQYAAVFGGDLALAQDTANAGAPVYAQLPTAVRAFFDNGGRRCHVVRVAGANAKAARWRVGGLRLWIPGSATTHAVVVQSAWPGSWSAGTEVEAEPVTRHVRPAAAYVPVGPTTPGALALAPGQTLGLQVGDLVRLDPASGPIALFARVSALDPATSTVSTDVDLPFTPATGTTPDTPAPAAVLPASIPLAAVTVLRFDLVVRRHTSTESRLLERLDELAYGAPLTGSSAATRPAWYDALQPVGNTQPDATRSTDLRQAPTTMALLETGLVVPDPDNEFLLLEAGDDDLGSLDLTRFTDPQLAHDTVFSLMSHVEQIAFLTSPPVPLTGMHALASIDEVALVAAPDATQRSWTPIAQPTKDPDPEPAPPPPPDWTHFHCCGDVPVVVTPTPTVDPTPVSGLPALDPISTYDESGLLDVQVALVTMAASRADQVALLSVPRHYDPPEVLAWQTRLTHDPRISDTVGGVGPLSYAGYWHPWVSIATASAGTHSVLRDVPPDGAVAGMIAARELARGAWIAPAGVPLNGVVRLTSDLGAADQTRLFDAHANLLVQQPGAFTALSAHTLTGNRDQLQVSVRRLLILLRKICLLLGARYTFEVNNDRFRQLVRMRFDRILAALVDRGALHAFRVISDGGVNTPQDQAEGRFIVVLQVAPTSPIEFITVTLVRTGAGLLEVLEG